MRAILLLGLFTFSLSSFGNTKICQYNFGTNEISVSYTTGQKTYTKEFDMNDRKYKIFVKDLLNPQEHEDYISIQDIKNPQYKITYALTCK